MRKYLLTIIVASGLCRTYSQDINTHSALDSIKMQFEQEAQKTVTDFEAYEAQARSDYFRYVQSIKDIWGGDTIIDNTKTEWVEYSPDFHSRSIVDFENGDITVEVAVNEKTSAKDIDTQLSNAIERMLNSRGSSCPYNSTVDTSEPLTERPILEGIVDLSKYDTSQISQNAKPQPMPPTPKAKGGNLTESKNPDGNKNQPKQSTSYSSGESRLNELQQKRDEARANANSKLNKGKSQSISLLAKKIVEQSPKKISTTKGKDGKKREVVQVQMSLVSDKISKNAALYKDLVAEFSQKFQVEEPLIFAVMEVESYFNPQATSWVPAYGLMQLVPTSGGTDAYRYVYKKSWIPTKSYLYNPRNNIELGTAYLRILLNSFSKVNDPHCRRLCVIAGYNTGAGNVSRAFIGSTNLNKAFPHINSYEYNSLYSHLILNLPHQETRNYVKKVTEKREKYLKK